MSKIIHDAKQFHWRGNRGSAEMSTLEANRSDRKVFCDLKRRSVWTALRKDVTVPHRGFFIQGRERMIEFLLCDISLNADDDIESWTLVSIGDREHFEITIWND